MTTTFEDAKVGERAWSMKSGWVEIVETRHSESYPISVRNRDGENESYTLCGRHYHGYLNQSLFWDEIKIEPPQKPLPDLDVDTKVMVWNNDGTKHNRYFAGWCAINGLIMTYDNGATSWSAIGFTAWPNWELAE